MKQSFNIVEDFGASSDGAEDASDAFRQAFRSVEAENGGKLLVPAGTYLTGPWNLPSNLELEIAEGAVVRFLPEFSLYPPVWTRWEGVECWAHHPLVFAHKKRNLRIFGGGVLDGSGQAWWQAYREIRASGRREPSTEEERRLAELNAGYRSQASGGGGRETQFLRPPLLQCMDCDEVRVEGITLRNSPFWNTHALYSRKLVFRNLKFENPPDAPNTDGLDIDSCADVLVDSCEFRVGDDCLVLKSGSGADGRQKGIPTQRVRVSNCTMFSGHGGVVVGSETAGGIRDVEVSDCRMVDTDRGIRIKTRRSRGGALRNLVFSDIQISGGLCPLVINAYYRCGADPQDPVLFSLNEQPIDAGTPSIEGLRFERVHASGYRAMAAFIAGLPEAPIRDLVIRDCNFSPATEALVAPSEAAMYAGLADEPGRGLRMGFVERPRIEAVEISGV